MPAYERIVESMRYGHGQEMEKFEIAMEAIGLAWWWMELPSGVLFSSPNKARMLGYEPEGFYHYTKFTELVHPDDLDRIMTDMRNHLDGKAEMYETSYRIRTKQGDYIRFFDRGKIVGKKDNEVIVAGFVFDEAQYGFRQAG